MSKHGSAWDDRVIARLITTARLRPYLEVSAGDTGRAVRLYESNAAVSGRLLASIALVEVIVRNAMDVRLREWARKRYDGDESWIRHAPLDSRGRADALKAQSRSRGSIAPPMDDVIPELSIGFWRYLTASRYYTSLWIPALANAFPLGNPDLATRRKAVEGCLQRLHYVHNRAAHHEPLLRRELVRDVEAGIRLSEWVNNDAGLWIASRCMNQSWTLSDTSGSPA